MSLDFALTQFYRLAIDDIVLMVDVFLFYRRFKKDKRSIKEYVEVLANLVSVEAQNFEDIDETKLSQDREERLDYVFRDYFMSVVLRYILDDLSQFPFWSAKIALLTSGQRHFGSSIVNEFWDYLKAKFAKGEFRRLYEGVSPYLCASFIINFEYIRKSTYNFFSIVISKIPKPPPTITKAEDGTPIKVTIPPSSSASLQQTLKNSVGSPAKNKSKSDGGLLTIMDVLKNVLHTTLSHSFLVLSVSMICDPMIRGDAWLLATWKFWSKYGFFGFYNGLRARTLFNLIPLPLSPYLLFGIPDIISYRQMIDHRVEAENVFEMARELSKDNKNDLLNYGFLTAIHAIPGFISLVGMRFATWLIFGSSNHRKQQIRRRKEIVEAHIHQIKKRSSANKFSKAKSSQDLKSLQAMENGK